MSSTTQDNRRMQGCGWEPSLPAGVTPQPWTHPGYSGPPLTKCPGYTTRLPVVVEVARLRVHWRRGSAGELTEPMEEALEILEGAANQVEAWIMKNPPKAGA